MSNILGDIVMTRGDSYPLILTIKDSDTNQPINLTGYSFKLTVTKDRDPVDSSSKIFEVIGVVDPDQINNTGKVSFTPSTTDTSIAGKFYYDIQLTYNNVVYTINNKNKFIILQDHTK